MTGRLSRLSVNTARKLLDFTCGGSGPLTAHGAEEQLRGAVALHNVLVERRVAYLADEVGMGKTYVALGVVALLRHFQPDLRVLIIAPRENIQRKWIKEIRNFTSSVLRFPDLRTRALHDEPARAPVFCRDLLELVREAALDADRDLVARLSSFSFGLGEDSAAWGDKREALLKELPWLDRKAFGVRDKEAFKDAFACGVNAGLPEFDLVVVDEGHNLKAGFKKGVAARNRVLALALGRPVDGAPRFRGAGPRARRVLFLSATPIENDFVQLWNQLDVLGLGEEAPELADPDLLDEVKRACARFFLLRRVTSIRVGDSVLTKNQYRREWRSGGVTLHDEPLAIPDHRQQLTVALVQKKVAEIVGESFNNSFQIGMLASFESFLRTAKIKYSSEDATTFDMSDQTEEEEERLGVDVRSVNQLARSHRRRFGREMPHPKMDAVVNRLWQVFLAGQKALVFVRRVASVIELKSKLDERYDDWLMDRLRAALVPGLHGALDAIAREYGQRRARRSRSLEAPEDAAADETAAVPVKELERGGTDSLFAWFLRGEGPGGDVLSGAVLRDRFTQDASAFSTFFEDNYVSWLLGVPPGSVMHELAKACNLPVYALEVELAERAARFVRDPRRRRRLDLFLAVQRAALELMSERWALRERARDVLACAFVEAAEAGPRPAISGTGPMLEVATFWTVLRNHPTVNQALLRNSGSGWTRDAFVEREVRRALVSTQVRLGHPFVDLFAITANRMGHLRASGRERAGLEVQIAEDFAALLARQSTDGELGGSFEELAGAAANLRLLLAVNDPELLRRPLVEVPRRVAQLLRQQQPIAGMFGEVNRTLVTQFRMPGYPRILITTDLLQEGEDLHPFCSEVHHYGLAWMPSSIEQRVGRVDRIGSLTERRLQRAGSLPDGNGKLQVYFPYLSETVERLQAARVFERLDRFMHLMHEGLGPSGHERSRVALDTGMLQGACITPLSDIPLRSAFGVQEEWLRGPDRPLQVTRAGFQRMRRRVASLRAMLADESRYRLQPNHGRMTIIGEVSIGRRVQPFSVFPRSYYGRLLLRCVSPVGLLTERVSLDSLAAIHEIAGTRLSAVFDQRFKGYDIAVESDVLLDSRESDQGRLRWLIGKVVKAADRLERVLIGDDRGFAAFENELSAEVTYER